MFGATTLANYGNGMSLFAGDSDGQMIESTDNGDHWSIMADLPPISKGDFYRAMSKGRAPIANLNDVAFNTKAIAGLDAGKV